MNNFRKYAEDDINEMANLSKHDTGIDNYKFNILQVGNKKLSHDARVKVFISGKLSDSFIIAFEKSF